MQRRLVVKFAVLSLLAPFVTFASPPSGAPPKNAAEAFAAADLVFEATVERVFKDDHGYDSSADVRVQRVWKGTLGPSLRIDGKGGPTYPARLFELGKTYLFYLPAAPPGQPLRADSYLHRVLAKGDASEDLKFLSAPHAGRGNSR
ncbi:MAG: hypothetical protein M3Y55_04725 [Pseudomonadota bacterium]|nr:hypothetical protein [Pseudomonadota bacterium]